MINMEIVGDILSFPKSPGSWMQLRDERDSYREKFNEQEQKIQKLTRKLENERILNDYVRTEKKRPWEP